MEKTKIRGGHTVEFDWRGAFVTDDSGERGEIDTERNIEASEGSFHVPIVGGFTTFAGAEEAMYIAARTGQRIKAGDRRFRVEDISSF